MPQMGVPSPKGRSRVAQVRGRADRPATSRCSRSRPTRSTPKSPARPRASSSRSSSRRRDGRRRHRAGGDRARGRRAHGAGSGSAARAGHAGRGRRLRGGSERDRPADGSDACARRPSPGGSRFRQRPHLRLPVVARIASEPASTEFDPGTGTGGRVTKKDILAFVESGGQAEAAAQPALPPSLHTRAARTRRAGTGPRYPGGPGPGARRKRAPRRQPHAASPPRPPPRSAEAPSRSPARRSSPCPRCARASPSTCAARSTRPRT